MTSTALRAETGVAEAVEEGDWEKEMWAGGAGTGEASVEENGEATTAGVAMEAVGSAEEETGSASIGRCHSDTRNLDPCNGKGCSNRPETSRGLRRTLQAPRFRKFLS